MEFSLDALTLSNGTKTWDATTDNWFGSANWASHGAPSYFDDVTINNGGKAVIANPLQRKAFANSINITDGTLGAGSPLQVRDDLTLATGGTLELDLSAFNTESAIVEVGDLVLAGGTLRLTGPAVDGLQLIAFSGDLIGSLEDWEVFHEGSGRVLFLFHDVVNSSIAMAAMPVPEPGTLTLLGLGAIAAGALAYRRRRRSAENESQE